MAHTQITDFFDPAVQHTAGAKGSSVYRMENETGTGSVTCFLILPGIELFYNDFHMWDAQNQNKLPQEHVIELNHCRENRFECKFENGDFQYLCAGGCRCTVYHSGPERPFFRCLTTTVSPLRSICAWGMQTIRQLEAITGDLDIDLQKTTDNSAAARSALLCGRNA